MSNSRFLALFLACLVAPSDLVAQRLPSGPEQSIRERSFDLRHLRAELTVVPDAGRVEGSAEVTLAPLAPLDAVELDAIGLDVVAVNRGTAPVAFAQGNSSLRIELPATVPAGEEVVLQVEYSATPKAGMYFQPDRSDPSRFWITTYGEGGLAANWLPLYNSPNDKLTTEMVITVPKDYVVISNGSLVEKKEGRESSTWHWKQERPHSDYLIALYIGDYERGDLLSALDGKVSVGYWVPRGRGAEGAYAFRNTTRMIEHFSKLFGYDYPWVKYDQIVAPDYPVGAMEHTGVTGHDEGVLRHPEGAPDEFGPPDFDHVADVWSAEATISHELGHHWFGDDLTCAHLSLIWLNESFASYLMMLWDEESRGHDQLLWDVELARRRYFDSVDSDHVIRPLEWSHYDNYADMYSLALTYLKGAAVLHMLRSGVGDEAFYASLGDYLRKHSTGNVVTEDLLAAFRDASGRNVHGFFDDWVWGGGSPRFEVSYRFRPDRGVVDLLVQQTQALVDGQGLFTLPVGVRVDTSTGSTTHSIEVSKDSEHYLLPTNGKPLMVSFDGRGDLVARIEFMKPAAELLYQATHDELPGRLRARAQLASRYPGLDETRQAMSAALAEGSFWAERADAARLLGSMRTAAAMELVEKSLADADYRVRKGAVLALAGFGSEGIVRLRRVIANEPHSDVVATAIVALSQVDASLSADFLSTQFERDAWYDEIRIAVARAATELRRQDLLPLVRRAAGSSYNQAVRQTALEAWEAIAPADAALHAELIEHADGPILALQTYAVEALGRLGVEAATPLLEETAKAGFDGSLAALARQAVQEIRRVAQH